MTIKIELDGIQKHVKSLSIEFFDDDVNNVKISDDLESYSNDSTYKPNKKVSKTSKISKPSKNKDEYLDTNIKESKMTSSSLDVIEDIPKIDDTSDRKPKVAKSMQNLEF